MFKREGWSDYFVLSISKTRKQMHKDVIKFSNNIGQFCNYVEDNVAAIVKRMDTVDEVGNLLFAICFFNIEDLTLNTIVHECVHIALAHEEMVLRFELNYQGDDYTDEERLAYFIGETTEAVLQLLKKEKYIDSKIWKAGDRVRWEYKGLVVPTKSKK